MCQFISWIEYEAKNYFLTNADLLTKEGVKLLAPDVVADLCGHGAIRAYYPELKDCGINKECADFSKLSNFPEDIVKAIKSGAMTFIKYPVLELLNENGAKEYEKIRQPAWQEYKKIRQPALEEYKKIAQAAWKEYEKIEQPALEEYEKRKQDAWQEYRKIEQPALEEYEKRKQDAWQEYRKIEQPAWHKVFMNKKHRKQIWR